MSHSYPLCENYKPIKGNITMVAVPGGILPRTVVCAANKFETGLIICGARHFDRVMHTQLDAIEASGRPKLSGHEQGFIDQWGNFMSRKEACLVAISSGQKLRNPNISAGDSLYSEDLY